MRRPGKTQQALAAGLLDAPAGTATVGGPSPESTMVDRIFDALDTNGDGMLSFEEIRLLAERTGGVALTSEDYLVISQTAGFDAAAGVDRASLHRIYVELSMGDAAEDFAKITGGGGASNSWVAGPDGSPLGLGLAGTAANPLAHAMSGGLAFEDIDNSSGDDEPESSDDELKPLPDFFGRASALLSKADGGPTMLCKAAYVVLVVGPLFSPFVYQFKGDPSAAVPLAGVNLGCLLAGAPALHSLQLATRQRRGLLARLGAKQLRVRRSAVDILRRWHRLLRALSMVFMLFGAAWVGFLVVAFGGTQWSWPLTIIDAVVTMAWLFTFLVTAVHWWLSLKVATILIAAPVTAATRAARTEARRLEKSRAAIDEERWRTEVEAPALRLAKETMLVLSKGWGAAVGCVAGGAALVAISIILFTDNAPMLMRFSFCLPFALVPPLLAIDPAAASSKCAKLEDQINSISGCDASFTRGMVFLKYLKSLNKDQGLVRPPSAVYRVVHHLIPCCTPTIGICGVRPSRHQTDPVARHDCRVRRCGGVGADDPGRGRARGCVRRCGRAARGLLVRMDLRRRHVFQDLWGRDR